MKFYRYQKEMALLGYTTFIIEPIKITPSNKIKGVIFLLSKTIRTN